MVALKLEVFATRFGGQTIAIAFHDLETGDECYLRADLPFHPASTFKVAVMMEAFHQAEQGLLALDDQISVVNSFASIADGSLFSTLAEDDADTTLYELIGDTESVRELLRLMIMRSSNLATNLLIQKVGATRVTAFLRKLGVQDVQVLRGPEDNRAFARGLNNSATARGLMQIMRVIAEGRVVSRPASDAMIEILLGQEFNEGIPAGLPGAAKAAHKTGWNDRLYHDFGIIMREGRRPSVLAVMTSGFETAGEAHACVAQISHLIYGGSSY